MLWGHAGFFALFASGRLGWLLLGWILAPAETVFVLPGWILALAGTAFAPRGYILRPSCRSGPNLKPQEPVLTKSFENLPKMKRLGSSTGSLFGHILTPLPRLLTFVFLVAPVANACMFFGSQFPSLIFV